METLSWRSKGVKKAQKRPKFFSLYGETFLFYTNTQFNFCITQIFDPEKSLKLMLAKDWKLIQPSARKIVYNLARRKMFHKTTKRNLFYYKVANWNNKLSKKKIAFCLQIYFNDISIVIKVEWKASEKGRRGSGDYYI